MALIKIFDYLNRVVSASQPDQSCSYKVKSLATDLKKKNQKQKNPPHQEKYVFPSLSFPKGRIRKQVQSPFFSCQNKTSNREGQQVC